MTEHRSRNLDVTMDSQWSRPETVVLHTAYRSDLDAHAVTVPIYQTAAFDFSDTRHAERVFRLQEDGNTYTRVMNPTCDVLERRMTAIEGGAAALAVASGQAAILTTIVNLCRQGDNIVTSTSVYGGTWDVMANLVRNMGIEARFVDADDIEGFRRATDERTRCYFAELLSNPVLRVFPLRKVAAIAKECGVPVVIDNTLAPMLCRPFEHGASIVLHSTTKYVGGHGNSIGGVIIDGGTFDWSQHPDRFPMFTRPDPAHGNVIWTEVGRPLTSALGRSPFILRARMTVLRDMGACMSPFNAWLFLLGLETLPLRIRAHCRNAQAVAEMLQHHPKVATVSYPGLSRGASRDEVDSYLRDGYGGLVQFEVQGGVAAGRAFIEALRLFYTVPNIGDARSLATHPASTTHAQLPKKDQLAAGVTPGGIRLSVGIEHIEDILTDISRALDQI